MSYEDATTKIINYLFEQLSVIKPAFKQAWPTDKEFQSAKYQWIRAFMDAGLRDINRIKKGMETYRLKPTAFIPSPGEFIDMCKIEPSDVGAPPLNRAYKEASYYSHPANQPATWSHPAVKHAWSLTGAWEMQQSPRRHTLPEFEKNYNYALNLFANGELRDLLEDKQSEIEEMRQEKEKQSQVAQGFENLQGKNKALKAIKEIL